MALKHLLLLLVLLALTFFDRGALGGCDVTCSTDYNTSLNCSCADAVQTRSVFLHINCSDEDLQVDGSCEVKPSQSWCIMSPEMFNFVASVSTLCSARVTDGDGEAVTSSESPPWYLCDVVKPEPPSGLQVTPTKDFYNITWDHVNELDCLNYMVRIRNASELSKGPVYSLSSDTQHLLLDQTRLQPRANYAVDVRTKMCPDNVYRGPWSEWSPTVELTTTGTNGSIAASLGPGTVAWHLFYIPSSVLIAVVFVVLVVAIVISIKKHLFLKIPKPDHFFTPLYSNYGGNFKEWVKPVFSECDYLIISTQPPMKSEHSVIQWDSEKLSCMENTEAKHHGHFPHELQVQESSALPCWDGGSQTNDHVGHISIHTVTLSEEEGHGEEGVSGDSAGVLRSGQDGESFELFGDGVEAQPIYGLEHAESGLRPPLQHQISDDSSVDNNDVPLHIQFFEAERASLDSLILNEQSEDGYPHVDLDTIDSGYGEYNSPGASQGTAEQPNLFHEHINFQSNYVKQWMVCRTIEEG